MDSGVVDVAWAISQYLPQNRWIGLGNGRSTLGQIGDGNTGRYSPVQVLNAGSDVKCIAAGQNHSMFVKNDGSLWAFGEGVDGQLGHGTYGDINPTPQKIMIIRSILLFAAGTHLHKKTDGTVWGTGGNNFTRWLSPLLSRIAKPATHSKR